MPSEVFDLVLQAEYMYYIYIYMYMYIWCSFLE